MNNNKTQSKIKLTSLLARMAIFALSLYLVVSLVATQVDIVSKRHQLSDVKTQLSSQMKINDEAQRILSSDSEDDYIERIARDKLGYVRPDERVFQDTSGK